jgi:hypothetical protein
VGTKWRLYGRWACRHAIYLPMQILSSRDMGARAYNRRENGCEYVHSVMPLLGNCHAQLREIRRTLARTLFEYDDCKHRLRHRAIQHVRSQTTRVLPRRVMESSGCNAAEGGRHRFHETVGIHWQKVRESGRLATGMLLWRQNAGTEECEPTTPSIKPHPGSGGSQHATQDPL